MQRYYITIITCTGPYSLYIKGRKGLTGAQVAAAWNARRPTRCIEVRDARTHEVLWADREA